MTQTKTIERTYLCDCGANNTVASTRRDHKQRTVLFYCRACGQPSQDVCTLCSRQTPPGSKHAFCQGCGASGESIRRGAENVNLSLLRSELLQAVVAAAGSAYVMQTSVLPYIFRRNLYFVQRHETDPLALSALGIGFALFIAPAVVVPLYTLLTGAKPAPFSVRSLAQAVRIVEMGGSEGLEEGLTDLAHQARRGIRRTARRVAWRWRRSLKRSAKRLAGGDATVDAGAESALDALLPCPEREWVASNFQGSPHTRKGCTPLHMLQFGFSEGNGLFDLGTIVATPAAISALREAGVSARTLLTRHVSGDWGEIPPDDQGLNETALEEGARILSAYRLPGTGEEVWIITAADRSSTMMLLPEES